MRKDKKYQELKNYTKAEWGVKKRIEGRNRKEGRKRRSVTDCKKWREYKKGLRRDIIEQDIEKSKREWTQYIDGEKEK